MNVNPPSFRGRIFTDRDTRCAYSEGAGPFRIIPEAVVAPEDAEDLASLVTWARAEGIPLTPRGSGSGMPGGNVGPGIVVDLHRITRPLRVSAHAIVNAGAAVTYGDIDECAKHFNLRLPPDPSSGAFCTIGGMVATNASGPRSFQHGAMRPWVRGVEFVSADGEIGWIGRAGTTRRHRRPSGIQHQRLASSLKAVERLTRDVAPLLQIHGAAVRAATPRTSKNSAGYALLEYLDGGDVLDLIIGSEGTLGFITRVEATLAIRPESVSTVLLGLDRSDDVPEAIAWLRSLQPTLIELFDTTFLSFVQPEGIPEAAAVLVVEFERPNAAAARGAAGDAVRGTDHWCRYARTGLSEEDREALWLIRHSASARLASQPDTLRSVQVVEDGCVPFGHLGRYLDAVRTMSEAVAIPVAVFGHGGDGHLHVNALVDTTQRDFIDRLRRLHDGVLDTIIDLGGTPSGEHGDGRLRVPALERIYGAEVTALFRSVKRAFDPEGILNPGVIVPAGTDDIWGHLKIGTDAAAIPDYIAEQLRDIERSREWRTPKHTLVS